MHTTINYTNNPDKAASALRDIGQWFGDNYPNVEEKMLMLVQSGAPYDKFAAFAGLAGISGYPVMVWYDYLKSLPTGA